VDATVKLGDLVAGDRDLSSAAQMCSVCPYAIEMEPY
jgi:hypothetical protein